MPCRHFRVSGHVQGVFFRATAQETAGALGLCGWVRNTADGQVELVACGEDEALAELERWLRHGPPRARVNGVTVRDAAPENFTDFSIRY